MHIRAVRPGARDASPRKSLGFVQNEFMFSTEELGFKKISKDNWRNPDPIWGLYLRSEGDPIQAWVEDFLSVQLEKSVPLEIRQMFEVARSAFVYGLMCYPLVTLGAEQMCRVADAAVVLKCRLLKLPKSDFAKRLDRLLENGVIKPEDKDHWDYLRFMRNQGSHPKIQTILTPVMCLDVMKKVADLVNDLFPAPSK